MRLEILQVPDCPNVTVLEDRIGQAIAGEPVTVDIEHRLVTDQEQAVATGMTGSPTLLIDGRDPFAVAGSVPSLSCRLYPSADGLDGAPSVPALRAALGLPTIDDPGGSGDTTSCCPPAAGNESAAEALNSWRADARPADPTSHAVHQAILRSYADRGRPPTIDELSDAVAGQAISASSILRQLHDTDAIRLDGHGAIASAYPFSTAPTPHQVRIADGPVVHAMCAVDALGLAAMLDTDIEVTSSDPLTQAPITVTIRNQHLSTDPASAVVFVGSQAAQGPSADTCCNYLNFFADRSTAARWATDHPDIGGEVLDLAQAHTLGNQIFANLIESP
ncbi:organomercurial lyase [Nocardia tengchongensis]|uniref:organomercurial lyase n=1 Tax=Nocardia tengchongensis TaxID=2055889 RepID=UPI0036C39FE1